MIGSSVRIDLHPALHTMVIETSLRLHVLVCNQFAELVRAYEFALFSFSREVVSLMRTKQPVLKIKIVFIVKTIRFIVDPLIDCAAIPSAANYGTFDEIFPSIYLSRLIYNYIDAISNTSHLQIDPVVSSSDADMIHPGYLPHVIDVRCNISRKLHVLRNRSNARCA